MQIIQKVVSVLSNCNYYHQQLKFFFALSNFFVYFLIIIYWNYRLIYMVIKQFIILHQIKFLYFHFNYYLNFNFINLFFFLFHF